jgi:hypothetical protein
MAPANVFRSGVGFAALFPSQQLLVIGGDGSSVVLDDLALQAGAAPQGNVIWATANGVYTAVPATRLATLRVVQKPGLPGISSTTAGGTVIVSPSGHSFFYGLNLVVRDQLCWQAATLMGEGLEAQLAQYSPNGAFFAVTALDQPLFVVDLETHANLNQTCQIWSAEEARFAHVDYIDWAPDSSLLWMVGVRQGSVASGGMLDLRTKMFLWPDTAIQVSALSVWLSPTHMTFVGAETSRLYSFLPPWTAPVPVCDLSSVTKLVFVSTTRVLAVGSRAPLSDTQAVYVVDFGVSQSAPSCQLISFSNLVGGAELGDVTEVVYSEGSDVVVFGGPVETPGVPELYSTRLPVSPTAVAATPEKLHDSLRAIGQMAFRPSISSEGDILFLVQRFASAAELWTRRRLGSFRLSPEGVYFSDYRFSEAINSVVGIDTRSPFLSTMCFSNPFVISENLHVDDHQVRYFSSGLVLSPGTVLSVGVNASVVVQGLATLGGHLQIMSNGEESKTSVLEASHGFVANFEGISVSFQDTANASCLYYARPIVSHDTVFVFFDQQAGDCSISPLTIASIVCFSVSLVAMIACACWYQTIYQHREHQFLLQKALDDNQFNTFRDFRSVPEEVRSGYLVSILNIISEEDETDTPPEKEKEEEEEEEEEK